MDIPTVWADESGASLEAITSVNCEGAGTGACQLGFPPRAAQPHASISRNREN